MSITTSTYALDRNYHNTPSFHHHIDIPPRKLNFTFSPKFTNPNFITTVAGENSGEHSDEDPDDPYSSDYFRIYEFKVRKCTRSRSHDWTDCPFAHPGEKARRRDPRRYNYSGEICPEFRLTGGGGGGACSKGERCEFSHGVFECWLHPDRYRTEPCKDGVNCTRKVCFFAHTPQQLRFPEKLPEIITPTEKKMRKNTLMANSKKKHCCKCVYCLHNSINLSSPTSTLTGAPHFSPPPSPSPPLSPVFRKFGDKLSDSVKCELLKKYCYEDVVNELMSSMEAMNVSGNGNGLWVDVCKDQELDFSGYNQNCSSGINRDFFNGGASSNFDDGKLGNENGLSCPDLGWVNDLLM